MRVAMHEPQARRFVRRHANGFLQPSRATRRAMTGQSPFSRPSTDRANAVARMCDLNEVDGPKPKLIVLKSHLRGARRRVKNDNIGDYARMLTSHLHATLRVWRAPGIPCALCFFEEQTSMRSLGASRRENAKLCLMKTNMRHTFNRH